VRTRHNSCRRCSTRISRVRRVWGGDDMNRSAAAVFAAAAVLLCVPSIAQGQQPPPTAPAQQDTLDTSPPEAGDEEIATPQHDLVRWNHYDGDFFHIRLGGGFLYEGAAYAQNLDSEEQFDLSPATKVRDARIVIKGGFKSKRPITFSVGIMYDVPTNK